MEKETAQQRIIELRALLEDYSRRYYVENAPVISDFEFDRLMRELEAVSYTHLTLPTTARV